MKYAVVLGDGMAGWPLEELGGRTTLEAASTPVMDRLARTAQIGLASFFNQIAMMTTNLPLGYNRDLQLLKEVLFPAIADLRSGLQMAHYMLENISVQTDILNDPKYDYLFSVEVVNNLALNGTPFREAYKKVGLDIEAGNFKAPHTVHHTHEAPGPRRKQAVHCG